MPLAPSPLNPDHGLSRRPSLDDAPAVRRWISRRYGLMLSPDEVAAIITDDSEGSALRHRLRWAFTHDRWSLKLSRNGHTEAQSLESSPLNGARVYEWARHVVGRRTPAPVYPGEPWNVDTSFSHLIKSGPNAGVHWDGSVDEGFALWAHERYGLPLPELLHLHLTARRHRGTQHRSIAQIIACELSPSAQHSHQLSLLWLDSNDVIVDRDSQEVPVQFVPSSHTTAMVLE